MSQLRMRIFCMLFSITCFAGAWGLLMSGIVGHKNGDHLLLAGVLALCFAFTFMLARDDHSRAYSALYSVAMREEGILKIWMGCFFGLYTLLFIEVGTASAAFGWMLLLGVSIFGILCISYIIAGVLIVACSKRTHLDAPPCQKESKKQPPRRHTDYGR